MPSPSSLPSLIPPFLYMFPLPPILFPLLPLLSPLSLSLYVCSTSLSLFPTPLSDFLFSFSSLALLLFAFSFPSSILPRLVLFSYAALPLLYFLSHFSLHLSFLPFPWLSVGVCELVKSKRKCKGNVNM